MVILSNKGRSKNSQGSEALERDYATTEVERVQNTFERGQTNKTVTSHSRKGMRDLDAGDKPFSSRYDFATGLAWGSPGKQAWNEDRTR